MKLEDGPPATGCFNRGSAEARKIIDVHNIKLALHGESYQPQINADVSGNLASPGGFFNSRETAKTTNVLDINLVLQGDSF